MNEEIYRKWPLAIGHGLLSCILGDPGAVSFTTNILSTRLTAPGSPRMALLVYKSVQHFKHFVDDDYDDDNKKQKWKKKWKHHSANEGARFFNLHALRAIYLPRA